MPSERQAAGKSPEPKEWVRRLVRNQAITLDERQLGWWTFHLEDFLRYCRRRAEQVEAKVLARGYFDELSGSEPPVASLRIDQTRQALTVFLRGIEDWRPCCFSFNTCWRATWGSWARPCARSGDGSCRSC